MAIRRAIAPSTPEAAGSSRGSAPGSKRTRTSARRAARSSRSTLASSSSSPLFWSSTARRPSRTSSARRRSGSPTRSSGSMSPRSTSQFRSASEVASSSSPLSRSMLLTNRWTRYSGCGAVFSGVDSPGAKIGRFARDFRVTRLPRSLRSRFSNYLIASVAQINAAYRRYQPSNWLSSLAGDIIPATGYRRLRASKREPRWIRPSRSGTRRRRTRKPSSGSQSSMGGEPSTATPSSPMSTADCAPRSASPTGAQSRTPSTRLTTWSGCSACASPRSARTASSPTSAGSHGSVEREQVGAFRAHEYERALQAPNLASLGEGPDQLAQVIHIAKGDVDDEVGRTGKGHHAHRLRKRRRVLEQALDRAALRRALLDREDGLHRAADGRRIHVRSKAPDHASCSQLADAFEAGRGRHRDLLGKRFVGLPRIVLELAQQGAIDRIKFDSISHSDHILR